MTASVASLTGERPGHRVVVLPREMDFCNAHEVRATLAAALSDGTKVLVADALETTFCDCSGVRALTQSHHQAESVGMRLRIAASPQLRQMLNLIGADQILDTYRTVAEALAGA